MLKLLLGVAIAFAIGFLGFSAYTGNLNQLLQTASTTLQPIINIVQPTITQIQTTWNSIPPQIKGIITLAIPSMFALFFAWSKNRAMQKLQETKQEANQTITQMASENLEAKAQVQNLQNQVSTLQIPDLKITELTNDLGEAQKLVTEKQQIINGQTATINDLHRVIEELKLKEKTVTVVK